MKQIYQYMIALILIPSFNQATPDHPKKWPTFDRVIIWGHSPHSHTHAYIHAAFYKAFIHLGYPAYWLNDASPLHDIPLEKTLFITVGGHDRRIPIRSDCLYMIHNCDDAKYAPLIKSGSCIIFQVYTHDARTRDVTKLHDDCPYILYDLAHSTLYMPWATDLLPEEIDAVKERLPHIVKNNTACFIGTVWAGSQGNAAQIAQFDTACKGAKISFHHHGGFGNGIDEEFHKEAITTALIAPALQGTWQCEHGYIPCRIFKNISYGAMGITNNETVYELFNRSIIYNSDVAQLVHDAMKTVPTIPQETIVTLMDFVRDHHTYLNRIDDMLNFFTMVQQSKNLLSGS